MFSLCIFATTEEETSAKIPNPAQIILHLELSGSLTVALRLTPPLVYQSPDLPAASRHSTLPSPMEETGGERRMAMVGVWGLCPLRIPACDLRGPDNQKTLKPAGVLML